MEKPYTKYLGLPFKHHGRDKTGLDCYGLLIMYYRDVFGIELKDWWYEGDWSLKGENYFLENKTRFTIPVKTSAIHDIVLFCTNQNTKIINHAGIFVEKDGKIIQALKSGVCLSSIKSPILASKIEGFYRLCQG